MSLEAREPYPLLPGPADAENNGSELHLDLPQGFSL